jgi:hypothetical protein
VAKTDLVIRFPNKISRKHFMDWLGDSYTTLRYENLMDSVELEDRKTKKLTILRREMDYNKGVVNTTVGRMTDLRAVNLS